MSAFIVIGGSVVLFAVFVVLPACWLTSRQRERWAETYWSELRPPATEDAAEWTGPMHTGSGGAEKRMLRYFHDHGQILLNRTSDAKRKLMAALDARRRPGWMWRHRLRPMRRAVFSAPVAEPPLEPLPEPLGAGEPEHDAPLPAPLPGEDGYGLTDATEFGFLVTGSGLPPAPGPGGASPIGDALTAEMGIVPAPHDEDDLAAPWYAPDSKWTVEDAERYLASPVDGDGGAGTDYPDWKTGQFAAITQDGEVAS